LVLDNMHPQVETVKFRVVGDTKMKVCAYCNQEFRPNRDWQTFCCQQHQVQWHRDQLKKQRRLADTDRHRRAEKGIEPEPIDVESLLDQARNGRVLRAVSGGPSITRRV